MAVWREERRMLKSIRRFTVIPVTNDVEFECTDGVELIDHMLFAYGGSMASLRNKGDSRIPT